MMHDHDHGLAPDADAPVAGARKHPPVASIEDAMMFKLIRLVTIIDRLGDGWIEELFGISINEWRMLGLVHAHGPARASDLAERLLMDKSQLSRLIRALTAKKLIQSQPDKTDARAVALSVTAQGQGVVQGLFDEIGRRNELALAPLSAEEAGALISYLDRLIAHNGSMLQDRMRDHKT